MASCSEPAENLCYLPNLEFFIQQKTDTLVRLLKHLQCQNTLGHADGTFLFKAVFFTTLKKYSEVLFSEGLKCMLTMHTLRAS